jgi:tol-pal system protein YbgF
MIAALLLACVIDLTGQSATARMQAELAEHGRRVTTLEADAAALARRVGSLEELTRARGQDEILKMETMEQVRQEVANLRGSIEMLEHAAKEQTASGSGFQQDTVARLDAAEARVAALEATLGVKAGNPGSQGASPAAGGPGGAPPPAEEPVAAWSTPEEAFALVERALKDGKAPAARAVARAFLAKHPKHERVPEAHYRIAESHQNEGAYKEAASAFLVVVDGWPATNWAAWALLRQGECFESLGRKDDAKLFYEDVVSRYPKSKAAKEAKAKLARR